MWAPRVRVGSSSWSAISPPEAALYWRARRSTPAETTGHAVVGKPDGAAFGELDHLRQLLAVLSLRDRGQEADGNPGFLESQLDESAEDGGRVDHRARCSAWRG